MRREVTVLAGALATLVVFLCILWLMVKGTPEYLKFIIAHLLDTPGKINNLSPQGQAGMAAWAGGYGSGRVKDYLKDKARIPGGPPNVVGLDGTDVLERGWDIYRAGPPGSREVNAEAARGISKIWDIFGGLPINVDSVLDMGGNFPPEGSRSDGDSGNQDSGRPSRRQWAPINWRQ